MTTKEIIAALVIHLFIPLIGIVCYLILKRQMKNEKILDAPNTALLVLFATYGSLLIVLLTSYLWYWSGMASLGVFYLIFIAPLVMGIIAEKYRKIKDFSSFHKWTYNSALLYFIIAPAIFFLILLTTK